MIDTLFFFLQIVGVIVLIGWVVVHDRLEDGVQTRGPLAFKGEGWPPAGQGRKRRGRGGLTRRRGSANLKSWRH